MVFSNEGYSQVSGDPIELALDLRNALQAIKTHLTSKIDDADIGENIIVLAGKLSLLQEDEMFDFLQSISERPLTLPQIIREFDDFMITVEKDRNMRNAG